MRLFQLVKQANRPGPPESSIVFRVSATACVVIGIAACWAQGELSLTVTALATTLVVAGNVFSYIRRANPNPLVKVFVATAALSAFVWFFSTIPRAGLTASLGAVLGPLAVLFTWIQVAHAFDVPSRRDVGFSLAGSATLMAVAAAQALDLSFGLYVIVWAVTGLVALGAMWSSMAGGVKLAWRGPAIGGVLALLVAVCFEAVLPAPHASSSVTFPSSSSDSISISTPAGLGNGGGQPVRGASPSGPTRVGGFLGFAGPLDTAIRGSLGNEVVMRVRADRPSFWVAETFDNWNGRSWTESSTSGHPTWQRLSSGSPFSLPLSTGASTQGDMDLQTFYLTQNGANVVFHAPETVEVWFPAKRLYVDADGNIRSSVSVGPGSIYTVESQVSTPTIGELRSAGAPSTTIVAGAGRTSASAAVLTVTSGAELTSVELARFTQLPHAYPRVKALATSITAHSSSTVGKVLDLERWISTHTRYTTDIPPLTPGQDTVTEFLFGNRRGYCEQISTALAVMLRTLGIPAREATGYVPGPYDPITDLYDVQAKDAHAWVQVWFPGFGWQSFDPTASVPTANPQPADALAHDLVGALHHVPVLPASLAAGTCLIVFLVWRRRATRPLSWEGSVTRELERAARKGRLPENPSETLMGLAARLDERLDASHGAMHRKNASSGPATRLAIAAEEGAYGIGRPENQPDKRARQALLVGARRLARRARRARLGSKGPLQLSGSARASSHDAPAESSRR